MSGLKPGVAARIRGRNAVEGGNRWREERGGTCSASGGGFEEEDEKGLG